ncbi:MAG: hypothetical protein Q8O33_08045 [Pseudomonadota bacterium]|jgi:hypothetical protein|nr:hypothetical protein [Pseudomonadota bacterium]
MIRLDTVVLPDGLVWTDEFAAQSVAQTVRRTLDGSVVVFYGQHSGGLPITLESEPDAGWLTRAQVEALSLLANSPGGTFTLELRGQVFRILFRHHEPPAFEAKPLFNLANPQPGDFYLATLKLMTV